MPSEWRIVAIYEMLSSPVYQVYRLKDERLPDHRGNREVAGNYDSKEQAVYICSKKNVVEAEHFWERRMVNWEWIGHPDEGAHCQVVLMSGHIVEAEWTGKVWQRIGGGNSKDKVIKEDDIIEWRRV